MSATMSIAGSAASRLCMMMTGTPCSATTRAMSGSRCRPHTSLTMAAPASSAQAATCAFMVSIETGTPSADHGGQHRLEAPQFLVERNRRRRCRRDASIPRRYRGCRRPPRPCGAPARWRRAGSRKRPPSENESGVTLRMPMTSGRPAASSRASVRMRPGRRAGYGKGTGWPSSCRGFAPARARESSVTAAWSFRLRGIDRASDR